MRIAEHGFEDLSIAGPAEFDEDPIRGSPAKRWRLSHVSPAGVDQARRKRPASPGATGFRKVDGNRGVVDGQSAAASLSKTTMR